MERGPMALFGAIVAVGLGPALWLGVQLSDDDAPVGKPPATIRQQVPAAVETDQGGFGAGSEETTGPADDWIAPAPARPIVTSVSPSASVSLSPSASVSPSPSLSASPSESVEPSVSPSVPSAEPSEDESEPPAPPSIEASEPSTPAS